MIKHCDTGIRQEGLLSSITNTSIASESSPYSYLSDCEQMQQQPTRDKDKDMEDNIAKLSGVTMSTEELMRQYNAPIIVRPPGDIQPDPVNMQAPVPWSPHQEDWRKNGKRLKRNGKRGNTRTIWAVLTTMMTMTTS